MTMVTPVLVIDALGDDPERLELTQVTIFQVTTPKHEHKVIYCFSNTRSHGQEQLPTTRNQYVQRPAKQSVFFARLQDRALQFRPHDLAGDEQQADASGGRPWRRRPCAAHQKAMMHCLLNIMH